MLKIMRSIFLNYELGLAGQVLCANEKEALNLASSFFGCEFNMVYEGRKEKRPGVGTVREFYERIDGPQEHPFFCIIREKKKLIPNMETIVDRESYLKIGKGLKALFQE
jgi:hypothetical protein